MARIADLMTRQPWTVQLDDSLGVARRMIAEREIRHLPVLDGRAVVGMIDERALLGGVDRSRTVADVMLPVHLVDGTTPVEDVLDAMTERHWDAVVVATDDGVDGIFTASDAVRMLRDLMHRRHAHA